MGPSLEDTPFNSSITLYCFFPDQIQLRDQLNNCLTNDLDGPGIAGLDATFCFSTWAIFYPGP